MNKNNTLFLLLTIFFIVLSTSVIANTNITTFVIQETEKIALDLNVKDPDSDKLTVIYSAPLNQEGEWQTIYGDAGTYKTKITISDGTINITKNISIIVKKKEEQPNFESYNPIEDFLKINESESINFKVIANDLNNDKLTYDWFLDNKKVKSSQEYLYDTIYTDEGIHKIMVIVSDGVTNINKSWEIDVANFDAEELLHQIKNVSIHENEIISLDIPDFSRYGLTYSISDPLSKNEWGTGYNDAGLYNITVKVEGKGFKNNKTVKLEVIDVDRPPVFNKIENKVIDEYEELKIILNANDPDGDEINYSAFNLPKDAKLEGNIFTWKPGYDTVRKEGVINILKDRFGLLSKNFNVQFYALSNSNNKSNKITQNVVITVKNINSQPVIDYPDQITIKEGETFKFSPNVYDLDGDEITISYSGLTNTGTFASGFEDAGSYFVKITASDGTLETSKQVKVNINETNRAPIFPKIQKFTSKEGDKITLLLTAYDPDGDKIDYVLEDAPNNSYIRENIFNWVIPFSIADKKEKKDINLVFVASDGEFQTRQIVELSIIDTNRVPKIVNATKNIIAKVNKPVFMFVNAIDEDGDDLSYTWDFGFLDKHKATPKHQRTFTSKGTKYINVIVSDGTDSVEQIIKVNVI